jgi:hypothetical protein
MKKIIFFIFTLSILLNNSVYCQRELKGNCSKVWLDAVLPRIPGYILPLDGTQQVSNCNVEVNLFTRGLLLVDLQRKESSGNFVSVSGGSHGYPDDYPFSANDNLSPGIYRMKVERIEPISCSTGFVKAFKDGEDLGKLGTVVFGDYTNELIVGAPTQSDNSITFLNGNGVYLDNNPQYNRYFDSNESIQIDATASTNYNEYQIAIQEYWSGNPSWPGRWRALGNGGYGGFINTSNRPLAVEDLRDIWNIHGTSNWEFIPGNAYRLQVTIRNSNCVSWVDNLQWFYICNNPNWACRKGIDKGNIEPTISPNPVIRAFKMDGFTFNPISSVTDELIIHDLTGRLVKNFTNIKENEFDVSDLTTGVYFISVLRDNQKLFTKKLMVSH